jgi:hypothetical protein
MRLISIVLSGLVVIAMLLVYLLNAHNGAESSPATGEVEDMTNQTRAIPVIDANRPAVTETAAFAMG